MNPLQRPQAVFVLSTGRCGTMTLAHILDLSPDIVCHHEPSPRLIIESKRAYEGSPCSGEIFLACRIDLVTEALDKGLIYGECANRSIFFAAHMERNFKGRVVFIHLVRDLESFVQSATRREWYVGNPWDIGRIEPKGGWRGQSQREKIEWLWYETNGWIERFLAFIDPARSLRVNFEDLKTGNMEMIKRMFTFIGARIPDEQKLYNVLRQRLNASPPRPTVPPDPAPREGAPGLNDPRTMTISS